MFINMIINFLKKKQKNTIGNNTYFFGDSIAQGYYASPITLGWGYIISTLKGWTIHNFGNSGDTVDNTKSKLIINLPVKTNTDGYIFIATGVNDVFQTSNNAFYYSNRISEIVDYCISKGFDKKLIKIVNIYYSSNWNVASGSQNKADAYNTACLYICLNKGVQMIDVYSFEALHIEENILYDNLHPNTLGHSLIGNYINSLDLINY